jgi:meiotically up-regulated gene 157 (Mug157) protein
MLIASLNFLPRTTNTYPCIGLSAIDQIFRVMNEQSQPSFDADFNFISYYNWTGLPGSLAGSVNNGGNGELKGYTGMVGTSHRPSDDLSVYGESTTTISVLSQPIVCISFPYTGKCHAQC